MSNNFYLLGLLGDPVSHSLSPLMHMAALQALRLQGTYVPLAVAPPNVEDAIRGLPALSFRGVNVTIPHKQAVIPFLDELDIHAQVIRAVNTIVVGDKLVGYNTDWSGFLADIERKGLEVAGKTCYVLGAGGSARAIVYALCQRQAIVKVFARRIEQAKKLIAIVGNTQTTAHLLTTNTLQISSPYLIVNTTPLGMSPHIQASPLPSDFVFPPYTFIYDLIYNPACTQLMKQAESAGISSSNGLGMLLQQGAQAFTLWTGQEPDLTVMQQALDKYSYGQLTD